MDWQKCMIFQCFFPVTEPPSLGRMHPCMAILHKHSLPPTLMAILVVALSGCQSSPSTHSFSAASSIDTPISALQQPAPVFDFLESEDEGEFPADLFPESQAAAASMTPTFCALWNPEFEHRDNRCCTKTNGQGHRRPKACAPARRSGRFCNERTEAQLLMTGPHLDALDAEFRATGRLDTLGSVQAYCTANNGFLAHGVAITPTAGNAVVLNNPYRCTNYGTTGLVLALHRAGKALANLLGPGAALVVGDLSSPRGGCLTTRRGSHSGHTNGLDADIAFISKPRPGAEAPSRIFNSHMDYELNWWFLKTFVAQSPVCIHRILIDRKHIRGLLKFAESIDDPDRRAMATLLLHYPGHKNHYHIRVGLAPNRGLAQRCQVPPVQ